MASLRRENGKLSRKQHRLQESLSRESCYESTLREELVTMESELAKADQQIELLLASIASLEAIVSHKEQENRTLAVELSRLSAHANTSIRRLGQQITELRELRDSEVESMRGAYLELKRKLTKIRRRQKEDSEKSLLFVLSDEDAEDEGDTEVSCEAVEL